MGWFYGENARGKNGCRGRPFGPKATTQKKKKTKLETGERRVPWGFSFLIAVCSPRRHVEVSGWIAAT